MLLWENEPIKSTELAKICEKELGWKKATTYTVIKRLSERAVLKSENAVVTSLVSKEEVQQAQMHELLERTFEGSMPAFIAAFAKRQKLSEDDIKQIQDMIDSY